MRTPEIITADFQGHILLTLNRLIRAGNRSDHEEKKQYIDQSAHKKKQPANI
jgi:hypothetical protein